MKRLFFIWVSILIPCMLLGQSSGTTGKLSFNVQKEIKPAILNMVPESVVFVDVTGNNAIDASENCVVRFEVQNVGMGDGIGCVARIFGSGTTAGISFSEKNLAKIPVGGTIGVEIPVTSNMYTQDGRLELTFQVDEPNGFGTDPMHLSVMTHAFVAPLLRVTDYSITGALSNAIEKKKPFDLQVLLQNTQHGLAEDVSVSITLPDGVLLFGGEESVSFAQLSAGQQKSLDYSIIVSNNYSEATIPVKIHISEKYGKYAEDMTINLAFNQTFASRKIEVQEKVQMLEDIKIATLTSSVDKNIPQSATVNNNSFAFIIANENYTSQNFAQVPYALNDGSIFREYCRQALGIPERNIHFQTDATYGQMQQFFRQLRNTAEVNPDSRIILYYAGHGAPGESDKEAYLIPVDAYQVGEGVCMNLQELYDDLKSLTSSKITVFLDACFSGTNRDNTMLASARGVVVEPKKNTVGGNLVVFSAATGDETAWPYKEEGHGMFTYYLLKKLQETGGNVSYKELFDYLYLNVRRSSNNINRKIQTPTLNPSYSLGDTWEGWMLK